MVSKSSSDYNICRPIFSFTPLTSHGRLRNFNQCKADIQNLNMETDNWIFMKISTFTLLWHFEKSDIYSTFSGSLASTRILPINSSPAKFVYNNLLPQNNVDRLHARVTLAEERILWA